MTPAFLLLVTVFAIWPDTVSSCGGGTKPPVKPPVNPPGKDCYCGLANRRPSAKIAGGKQTGVNEYPWQVFIRTKKEDKICGGSVISDQWVLTAAHCVDNIPVKLEESDVKVYLGEHDRTVTHEADTIQVHVAKIIIHEKWDPSEILYDFALLRLTSEIKFTSHIRPICLPETNKNNYSGYTATASGWGRTNYHGPLASPHLREVDLTVLNEKECIQKWGRQHIEQLLCARGYGGKGICRGDSGDR